LEGPKGQGKILARAKGTNNNKFKVKPRPWAKKGGARKGIIFSRIFPGLFWFCNFTLARGAPLRKPPRELEVGGWTLTF